MPKKHTHDKSVVYVQARTLNDLCRYACNFDFTSENLLLTKSGSSYRLFGLGEELGDAVLAYYVNIEKKEKILKYTFTSFESNENEQSRFVSNAEPQPGHYINIIDIEEMKGFKDDKKAAQDSVAIVRLGSASDMVNAAIKKAVKSESLFYLYRFPIKKGMVLAGFDLIDQLSNGKRTFYYAILDNNDSSSFARFSYTSSKVDFTNSIGEHSYLYVKIVNLAEAFPFFKMPD